MKRFGKHQSIKGKDITLLKQLGTSLALDNTYVIGDVHGCHHTLLNLIAKLPSDAELIFVGDLCDKGNFSKEVIELVIENNYACVKGNHEHLFEKYILDAVEKNIHSPWSADKRYGGEACIQSYKGDIALIKKHLAWITKLPMYIQKEKYFITHGFALDLYKHKDNEAYYNDFLLRRYYQDSVEPKVEEDIINVFGHCVFSEVQVGEKFFCLDTGCPTDGYLSALCLGTKEITQVKMNQKDSSHVVKELTLELFNINSTLEEIQNITLKSPCKYEEYDVVSHEVLVHIVQSYKEEGLKELLNMKKKGVIFPKQLNRIMEL